MKNQIKKFTRSVFDFPDNPKELRILQKTLADVAGIYYTSSQLKKQIQSLSQKDINKLESLWIDICDKCENIWGIFDKQDEN